MTTTNPRNRWMIGKNFHGDTYFCTRAAQQMLLGSDMPHLGCLALLQHQCNAHGVAWEQTEPGELHHRYEVYPYC